MQFSSDDSHKVEPLIVSEHSQQAGFSFKQFHVAHELCAMKVGTDGVLLGAWASLPSEGRILDVGCGSGLVSLMLAQRQPELLIDAIDIDEGAHLQTIENVRHSPWGDRIRPLLCAVQQFKPSYRYDVLVSNPPYFPAGQEFDSQRQRARHDGELNVEQFFSSIQHLSHAETTLALVLPCSQLNLWLKSAAACGWNETHNTTVYSKPGKPAIRHLLLLNQQPELAVVRNDLFIHQCDGHYSADYVQLCNAFYLKM